MKNGDRLTGVITPQDKDIFFLDQPYSGHVQLPRAQIDRNEQQKLLAVAPLIAIETQAVVIKNQAVRHSGVDLTAGKKRSSSSTDKLGFKTAFEQRDTNMRLTFDGKYDYETSNSLEKTHKYLLSPGADYFFQPQLFWRNKVDYSQDFIAADYKNIDLSPGLGYSFYDSTEHRVEVIGLAGLKRTHFKETAGLKFFLGERIRFCPFQSI